MSLLGPTDCKHCGEPNLTWRNSHCPSCGREDFVPVDSRDGYGPIGLQIIIVVLLTLFVCRKWL